LIVGWSSVGRRLILGCTRKHQLRKVLVMEISRRAAMPPAADLWSRRAVDLCRVATCLCLAG